MEFKFGEPVNAGIWKDAGDSYHFCLDGQEVGAYAFAESFRSLAAAARQMLQWKSRSVLTSRAPVQMAFDSLQKALDKVAH